MRETDKTEINGRNSKKRYQTKPPLNLLYTLGAARVVIELAPDPGGAVGTIIGGVCSFLSISTGAP
jgi:hypothetical protein